MGVSPQNIGANGGAMHAQYPFIPQGPGLGQCHWGPQWDIPGISTQYMYGGAMDAQIPYMSQGVGPGQVHFWAWGPNGETYYIHIMLSQKAVAVQKRSLGYVEAKRDLITVKVGQIMVQMGHHIPDKECM